MELRQIDGFPGYAVSACGQVFRTLNTRRNPLPAPEKMATRVQKHGYILVQLRVDGRNRNMLVHRLIAMAFIGPPGKLDVNHKDGVKANNDVANLEYMTRSENVLHAFRLGLKKAARGERAGNNVLREADIPDIRRKVAAARQGGRAAHGAMRALAEEYGVSPSALDNIARGNCWKHVA